VVGQLTARFVATAKPGVYPDGDGLYLCITKSLARTWIYRFSWQGRRPEMGLGNVRDVSLAEARASRDEARRTLRSGKNPIEERREAKKAAGGRLTFGQIADDLLEAKGRELRSGRSLDQWRIGLSETSVTLRARPVDEIDTAAVLEVLKPLWIEKPKTADRLRGRIEAVLDAAKAAGHRTGENPARWRGHMAHLLSKPPRLARGHHAAMAYADVPAFLARLRESSSIGAMALEFAILTAARSGEILGARWSEIDIAGRVWIIPASRMKAAREHRVPLAARALAILEALAPLRVGEVVFPSPRGGRQMSHVVMQKTLARLGVKNATTHGFRSTFRDWAGNETHFPREIAEAALAHVVGSSVEQAYRRSDALEKRRALMDAWANYCEPNKTDNVIRLKG
jgi:integrase